MYSLGFLGLYGSYSSTVRIMEEARHRGWSGGGREDPGGESGFTLSSRQGAPRRFSTFTNKETLGSSMRRSCIGGTVKG